MFGGEESTKKVKVLSGGERTRLAMIKLLLEPVNLLILDEPTNHLDTDGREHLAHTIDDWQGPVLMTSHDRAFIERTRRHCSTWIRHRGGRWQSPRESPRTSGRTG